MKKIITISLLCIYLASVCGISVNRFYCCGVLKSSGITAAVFTKANPKDDNCCKHTQTVVKVNDSHEQVSQAQHTSTSFAQHHIIASPGGFSASFVQAAKLNSNLTTGPPLSLRTNPLFLLHCNYRI